MSFELNLIKTAVVILSIAAIDFANVIIIHQICVFRWKLELFDLHSMNSSRRIHCVCPVRRGCFSEVCVDFLWRLKRSANIVTVVCAVTLSTFWDINRDGIHLLSVRLRWILKSKWFLVDSFSCSTSLQQRIFPIHLFMLCSWRASFITIRCVQSRTVRTVWRMDKEWIF